MRHPDWEQRLGDYIRSAAHLPHKYGEHDCMLHCAKAAEAITGKDYGKPHRGKYDSPAKAARHLKRHKVDSPEKMLDKLFPVIPTGFAQRGDIVLTPPNDGTDWGLPGVVVGDVALVVAAGAVKGLYPVSRGDWRKAWRVG